MIHRIQLAPIVLAFGLISGSAHAALQGRNLDANANTFEAYYDTDLDITWLADANYAKTSGRDTDGLMSWAVANHWAYNLSLVDPVNNLNYDNWRLPTVVDTGTPGCDSAYTGTDCGYNVDTATGELAHLFYDELGNKAYRDTSGNANQPGWGLTNTGPFTNLQTSLIDRYWSDTEYAPVTLLGWLFSFYDGYQGAHYSTMEFYALAVSPGDVGTVPEADTWAMLLAGLGLVGAVTRRRRMAGCPRPPSPIFLRLQGCGVVACWA